MLTSLAMAAKIAVKRPQLLLVPLAAAALLLGVFFFVGDVLLDLVVSTLFLEIVPETGFFEFPWHLYAQYASHFNTLAIALFFLITVSVWMAFFFASYAKASIEKEESMSTAIRETGSMTKPIISLTAFFFILALFLAIVFWLIVNATIPLGAIGIIFPLTFLLLTFFLYITLLFVTAIMAIEKTTLRESIKKSYGFASKRFWNVVVLGILIGLVNTLILNTGTHASDLIADDTIALIVFSLFWAFSVGFVSLVLPVYYLRKASQ